MAVLPTGIGPVTGGYQIERSLRFNSADSAGLNRTAGTQTSNSAWTYSVWLKRGLISTAANLYVMRAQNPGNTLSTELFVATNDIIFFREYGPSAYTSYLQTTQVFRDPSAWYHIVLAYNPANSTPSDKVRLYINGVRVTAFLTTIYPSSTSQATAWNTSGNPQYIGSTNTSTFNGYMTEINFIDGQGNLTQNDFGETDASTGVWKPKAYTGTYGNNGFYLPFKTASQWSGYFDGTGDYASFSPTSALNAGTGDFTLEFWTFHLTSSTYQGYYYGGAVGSINFRRTSSNTIELAQDGVTSVLITSTTIPANQWVHVAVTRNSGTVRIFINGVSGGSVTYTGNFNSTGGTGTIGSISPASYNLNGYISNLRLITGTALYTANFTPPTAQLTAVSGTQLLTCQSSTFVDNSTNAFTITAAGDARPQQFSPFTLDVTDDHSGQGNNWIPNNLDLRTTGAGADILVDSPTSYGTDTGVGGEVRGNYATLNPLRTSNAPTNGNLDVSFPTASRQIGSTIALPSSGKWYFEATLTAISAPAAQVGVSGLNYSTTNYGGQEADSYVYSSPGTKGNNNSFVAYGASWTTNDVIGVAADVDAGSLTFYKNGVSQGAAYTSISLVNKYFVVGMGGTSINFTVNFGQRPFQKWNGSAYVANTAPSGFKALCTQNLPPVTIGATSTTQANKYMDVTLYTGNGAVRSITNSGSMQPDFVWDKLRSGSNSHRLFDAVRGVEKALYSNLTNAEATETGTLTSFNSNGFSLGTSTETNTNGSTYVAWQWNAGGSTVTNTSGTISSQVRANTTSGFSIVTYTGTGSNATVGHGLGVAPDFIIIKDRTAARTTDQWPTYHRSIGATGGLVYLNSNNGGIATSVVWNNTNPTSSVFSIGTWGGINYNTDNFVAYCFAAVPGYSAFGSYAGNGTTTSDGPFIYTGFRPAFVMVKAYIGAGENWGIYDKSRIEYNSSNYVLFPNLPNNENAATTHIDLLSNGFKLRSGNNNLSSYSYIYAAFAEHPFKYSLAR
jgi:hypothetical protein